MSELKNLEDYMVITGIILIVEGYFFTNILPSLIGFSIILYMVGVGLSISYKKITISIDKEDIELYNNKDDVVNIPVIIENNNGVPILVSIDIDSKLVSMSVDINSNDVNNNGNNNTNNNINDNNNDNNKKTILINGNEKKKFSLIFSPKTIGSSTNKIIFNIFDINKIFMKKIEKTVNIKVIPSVSSVKNYLKYSKNLKIALELLSEIKTGHESIEFNELREYVGGYSEKK